MSDQIPSKLLHFSDKEKAPLNLRIPKKMKEVLQDNAEKKGYQLSEYVIQCLDKQLIIESPNMKKKRK